MLWKLLDICLLRASPQDLPGSARFLGLMLCGYFLVDVLVALLNFKFGAAIGISLLDVLLLVGFARLVLQRAKKLERFNQMVAAMAGTGQLLGMMVLPIVRGLNLAEAAGEPASGLMLLWLLMMVWSLLVLGHIVRHALSVALMNGVGIGVLYSLTAMLIVNWVAPALA